MPSGMCGTPGFHRLCMHRAPKGEERLYRSDRCCLALRVLLREVSAPAPSSTPADPGGAGKGYNPGHRSDFIPGGLPSKLVTLAMCPGIGSPAQLFCLCAIALHSYSRPGIMWSPAPWRGVPYMQCVICDPKVGSLLIWTSKLVWNALYTSSFRRASVVVT